MIDTSVLKNNSVLICPRQKKESIILELQHNKSFLNIKFLTKETILKEFSATFSSEAIYYLSKKYNYSFENAEEVLKNVVDNHFDSEKFSAIKKIYDELKEKKLLKTNEYFKYLFQDKAIYIYGYSNKDVELKKTLDLYDLTYTYLNEKDCNYRHDVCVFKSIDDEVLYTFNQICSLIKNGISLNKIYFYTLPDEYKFIIKKYAAYHNLMIEYENETCLFETETFKKFFKLLETSSILESYNAIKEIIKNDPYDTLNKLIDCIGKSYFLQSDLDAFKKMLIYNAKKTKLKKIKYTDSLKIINHDKIVKDDEYVFMLGFSLGNYPKIYRDLDFYTDEEKMLLNKNTSKTKTEIEEDLLIKFLKNTKNVFVSYKKRHDKTVFFPSLLIEKLNMKQQEVLINEKRFSSVGAKIEVSKLFDLQKDFGVDNKYINTFSKKEIGYLSFDHRFKALDAYRNDDKLVLSYSQINEYNQCHFKYFVKRVLKLNIFEDNFNTRIGNLFHFILEHYSDSEINKEECEEYIRNNFIGDKELFFVDLLLPQIKKVIEINKDFLNNTFYTHIEKEKEIIVDIDDLTKLVGKIDKIMFDDENKNLIIIDYKTYGFKFNKEKIKYGIDLQLPIYAYLLDNKYPDYLNTGMYIQNICVDKKTMLKKPNKIYLLEGISLDDFEKLGRIDKFFAKSNEFKYLDLSLRQKTKFLNSDDFAYLNKEAKDQIDNTLKGIREGKFDISPIVFKNENNKKPCDYCYFKSICFVNGTDYKVIDLKAEK